MLPNILTAVGDIPVLWLPAAPENVWQDNQGLHESSCEGVVCHTMGGTLAGCDSWFRNPQSQASANFGISKNGEIHQYVELYGKAPYANGVAAGSPAARKMTARVFALSSKHGWTSQNKWTWSIEHEDNGRTTQITDHPKMFDASTRLCALLLASLPPERRQTFGHYEFDAVARPYCPGWATATWEAYDNRVKELIVEAEESPFGTPPEPNTRPVGKTYDWNPIKEIMDQGYRDAFDAMSKATAAFNKCDELFEELRRQGADV